MYAKNFKKHQGNSGNTPMDFVFSFNIQYSAFLYQYTRSIPTIQSHTAAWGIGLEPHGGVALPGTLNPAYWRHGLYLSIFNILHFYINIQETY